MAVIKDPQGATFIASQFVPENSGLEGVADDDLHYATFGASA